MEFIIIQYLASVKIKIILTFIFQFHILFEHRHYNLSRRIIVRICYDMVEDYTGFLFVLIKCKIVKYKK